MRVFFSLKLSWLSCCSPIGCHQPKRFESAPLKFLKNTNAGVKTKASVKPYDPTSSLDCSCAFAHVGAAMSMGKI